MPALSFTAPHVTPEMEVAEREALSEEERKRIDEDLYGTSSSSATQLPPTPTEPSDGYTMITQKVIDELQQLPASETREYWDAQTKASRFVLERESSPSLFLECDKDQSPATIATRMALYWKIRCKIFGPSRAYLPMRVPKEMEQDASTAMSKEDKTLLETGFLAVHSKDEHGRTVLFMDRIKAVASPLATRDATLRCLFFMIHALLQEDPTIQVNGCICVKSIKGYDLYRHFDRLLSKNIATLLFHCMPIQFKALHILAPGMLALNQHRRPSMDCAGIRTLVLPSMKQVMGKHARLRLRVHGGSCRDDSEEDSIFQSLQEYGISKAQLSKDLGGDQTHANFLTWWKYYLNRQESVESSEQQYTKQKVHEMEGSSSSETTTSTTATLDEERNGDAL